jgi:hypothetical protein
MSVAAGERLHATFEDRTDLQPLGEAGARGSSSRRISWGQGGAVLKHPPLGACVALPSKRAEGETPDVPHRWSTFTLTIPRSCCILGRITMSGHWSGAKS